VSPIANNAYEDLSVVENYTVLRHAHSLVKGDTVIGSQGFLLPVNILD
jgi:hypothetical protein